MHCATDDMRVQESLLMLQIFTSKYALKNNHTILKSYSFSNYKDTAFAALQDYSLCLHISSENCSLSGGKLKV